MPFGAYLLLLLNHMFLGIGKDATVAKGYL